MYLPKHFEQTDPAALISLMAAHPLATLVSLRAPGLTADHIPLKYDSAAHCLRGQVARANPLWREAAGQNLLAIFQGPQSYISPNLYPSKAQTHKVVPTWNYAVVHVHGPLQVIEDAPWLHALVSRLTDHHERSQPDAWAVGDAPAEYVQQMLRAIVGIEIPVQRWLGKFKLSQNRSQADREGVIRGLAQSHAEAQSVASAMSDLEASAPKE